MDGVEASPPLATDLTQGAGCPLILNLLMANQDVDPSIRVGLRTLSLDLLKAFDDSNSQLGMPEDIEDLGVLWVLLETGKMPTNQAYKALGRAIKEGRLDALELLLKRRCLFGEAISLAIKEGRLDVLELTLLEPKKRHTMAMVIKAVVKEELVDAFELLIKLYPMDGRSIGKAWAYAIKYSKTEIINYFYHHPGLVLDPGLDWYEACSWAARMGQTDALRTLVELYPEVVDHMNTGEWGYDELGFPYLIYKDAANSGNVETLACALSLGFEFDKEWFSSCYRDVMFSSMNWMVGGFCPDNMIAYLHILEHQMMLDESMI